MFKSISVRLVHCIVAALLYYADAFSQDALFRQFTAEDGLFGDTVLDLQAEGNQLLIITEKGLSSFNNDTFIELSNVKKLNRIHSQVKNSLFSSLDGSIYRYDSGQLHRQFDNIDLQSQFAENGINSIYKDEEGQLYITTIKGSLPYLLYGHKDYRPYVIESDDKSRYFLKELKPNHFLFGSLNGNPEANKLKVILSGNDFDINLTIKNKNDRSSFQQLEDGSFIFAQGFELLHFDRRKIINRSFIENKILALFQDSEGQIWIGLEKGGVQCYPLADLTLGSLINYLGGNTITSIAEDKTGNIWFGAANAGIFLLPASKYVEYSSPVLFSSEPKKPNGTEAKKDKQSIPLENTGTDVHQGKPQGGLNKLQETSTRQDSLPPKIYLTGINIMGRDTHIQGSYLLEHDMNFIEFYFAGIGSHRKQNIHYKYQMSGIDQDWKYTNNTSIPYTTLPPGKYTFHVYGINEIGVESTERASVQVTIKEPFWKKLWFQGMVVAIFILTVFLIYQVRVRHIRKTEAEKSALTKKMSDMELTALRAQMNPHFIFNILNSIQHYITENDTKSAINYLSKFARLIRSTMDNSRKQTLPLKDELEVLKNYIELEALRFENAFDYHIKVDEHLDIDDIEIPPLLIQPYVENAIWHGLLHKQGEKFLEINIHRQGDNIICEIKDNGVGREMSAQKKSKHSHKSKGMSITKERLDIINQISGSDLSILILDLIDPEGNAAGTSVKIIIPMEE